MLIILSDAIDQLAPFVDNGSCDRTKIVNRINEATQRLVQRPNSPVNMLRYLRYCTKKNMLALPREAEKVMWVDINGRPSQVMDLPYEFLSDGPGALTAYGCTHWPYLKDMGDGYPTFFEIPSKVTPSEGASTCDDITASPKKLIAFSTSAEDVGLEMRLMGKDELSADILTDGVPGEVLQIGQWENGVEGTVNANALPARTTNYFMNVGSVVKPVTKGYVSLYTYDATDHRMYFLAKYHPDETRPNYRWYKITAPNFEEGTCILLLVRLRYLPAKHDNDVLLIQNLGALKYMLMAISRENEREFEEAQAYEAKALQILRDQHSNNKNIVPQWNVQGPWGFRGVNLI